MTQAEKTEAVIAYAPHYGSEGIDYASFLEDHARDLARKLDAIMIAIAPPSFDVGTEYYRGRFDAFSAACDVLDPEVVG